ncbi:MAG TPA: cell division protein ZapA [Rhodocyclaceae bacterium]|nr:cell division protein ZapA [Rhodocyclaceae bacterium]
MEPLDIQLMGKQFSVSVKPDEREAFLSAVTLVEEKLQQLAGKTASGGETLALMTALNIAHEFIASQRSAGLDLPGYRRRIGSMTDRVDQALAKQEMLF